MAVKSAVNYAGFPLQAEYEEEVSVVPLATSIVVETENIVLDVESDIVLKLDASVGGRKIDVFSDSILLDIITETVETDDDGKAVVKAKGYLAGDVEITCVLRDTFVSTVAKISIEAADEPGTGEGDEPGTGEGDEPGTGEGEGSKDNGTVVLAAVGALIVIGIAGVLLFRFLPGRKL